MLVLRLVDGGCLLGTFDATIDTQNYRRVSYVNSRQSKNQGWLRSKVGKELRFKMAVTKVSHFFDKVGEIDK